MLLDQWWVATIPGLAIFIVSLGFNLLGDGLRDVFDPHGHERPITLAHRRNLSVTFPATTATSAPCAT